MNKKQFAIMDFTIGAFLNAFTATNDAEAIRLFTTWINDSETPNNNLHKYPTSYSLFYLGDFDDKTGNWVQPETKKELILGVSCVEEEKQKFTIKELTQMV